VVCLIWRVRGESPISSNSVDGGSSSNGDSLLIVVTIVCNLTWVNITVVTIVISISIGAGDVRRKPEVIDA
jgi:hypothetical protein